MDEDFRKRFLEDRKRKDEKRMKNREEKKEVERKCLIGRRNYCPKLRDSDQLIAFTFDRTILFRTKQICQLL